MILCFRKAECCYRAAEEVSRYLTEGKTRAILGDRSRSAICETSLHDKQRLLTQYALVRSVLRDFSEAHRRLNEAEAILEMLGSGTTSLERGIVDLHRAEVLTQQSVFLPGVLPEKMTPLGNHRQSILDLDIRRGADKLFDTHSKWGASDKIQKNAICVQDAMRYIDQARVALGGHRKNVWWVTWMFELRLKAMELQAFASLADQETGVLAHLGVEACPEHSVSDCDNILDNALRMVRLDVYRLARIVESYARCLLAVKIRQLTMTKKTLGDQSMAILTRQLEMHRRCRKARWILKRKVRQKEEMDEEWKDTALQEDVSDYVQHVIAETKSILDFTANWNGRPSFT